MRAIKRDPRVAKTPQDKPCPRCYTPCRLTARGWECPKHGVQASA